jgi:maleate isomerase
VTEKDNWGWRSRIGLFIVGNEAVPEAEWWAMAPPGVSVHAARVTAKSPWANWNDNKTAVTLAEDLARGARQFAAMRLSSVVLAHTTSSVIGGVGWDEATVAAIAAIVNGGAFAKAPAFVTTNGLDTMAALNASNVKRPFLVLPPWFPDSAVKAAIAYYTARGFSPAGHLSYDPGRKWRDIAPSELYANGMGFEQEIEPLYAQIRAACPADADGLLLGGTGFRCIGILQALEQDLKRPVISANQASLWHCLRRTGVREPVEGYGSLLRL